MEFDSPEEVEKEFPGLYGKTEQVEMMSDPADYDEELDKKKKKDKKDSKKDKGYATLADENSQDEDESRQAKKKLKGLLSGKKKDKDKDKEHKEKDSKKEKKLLEKEKKSLESERKSADKEVPFSSVRIPFSAERHRDIHAHRSSVPTALFASTPKSSKDKSGGESSPVAVVEKERSSSSAFNAFINAPTPLFLQKKKKKKEEKEVKEKEHKKDKSKSKDKKEDKEKEKHPSGVAKVKLKLMRSKNSLDDPHEKEKGELHVSVSHQFPEDPEALAKEIKKHEALLEQTHGQMKSCKKVTKKQEEQLWELQRTLTALKRKLRSINALSTAPIHTHAVAGTSSSNVASETSRSGSISNKGTSQSPSSNTIPPPSSSSVSPTAVSDKNKNHEKQGCEDVPTKPPRLSCSISPIGTDKNGRHKESPPPKSNSGKEGCNVVLKKQALGDREHGEETAPVPVIIPPPAAPPKKTARRSLDFSDIVVENVKKPIKSNNESLIQSCCSAVETCVEEEKDDKSAISTFEDSSHQQLSPQGRVKRESPSHNDITEHEKMEVKVIVHQESKEDEDEDEVDHGRDVAGDDDDSSVAGSEEDEDEALPSISSRTEENINVVLDDANAMIGSMHEELEAAAFVFGQKLSKRGGGGPEIFKNMTTVSKSEPTFETNDSSDVELIPDEEELPESFIEELIPELLVLPEFETPEYLIFENEQLASFNKAIQEEIVKEEAELEVVMEELENIRASTQNDARAEDDSSADDCDMERLIDTWKTAKSENEALQINVSRLRQLVALHRLEEFRLETRLRFLEDKFQPITDISPITATTPLHSES